MKKRRNEPMIEEIPEFDVPFPPQVTAEEIVARRNPRKLGSRPPNVFFLYRINYIKALKKILPNISMRPLSKHISDSWKKEPAYRKDVYKELFGEVEKALESRRRQNLFLIPERFPRVPKNNNPTTSTNAEGGNELQQDPQIIPEESIPILNFQYQVMHPPSIEHSNVYPLFPMVYNRRPRQIMTNKCEQSVGVILIFILICFYVTDITLQNSIVIIYQDTQKCNDHNSLYCSITSFGTIIYEFVIDIYVLYRLVNIFFKQNLVEGFISNSIMGLNFIRLTFTVLSHLCFALNMIQVFDMFEIDSIVIYVVGAIIQIILVYTIAADSDQTRFSKINNEGTNERLPTLDVQRNDEEMGKIDFSKRSTFFHWALSVHQSPDDNKGVEEIQENPRQQIYLTMENVESKNHEMGKQGFESRTHVHELQQESRDKNPLYDVYESYYQDSNDITEFLDSDIGIEQREDNNDDALMISMISETVIHDERLSITYTEDFDNYPENEEHEEPTILYGVAF
ncbi:20052_t:CDS:2 [Funneliformis geosporum]|uniref:20052_t:CDS:1 n=1 Tax=Funneliformis geosporum TaxID=1117311 RepID=A0A9W4SA94_9GLOM|nr:20052_t:CDS:2 [Funneliformis geosporum]